MIRRALGPILLAAALGIQASAGAVPSQPDSPAPSAAPRGPTVSDAAVTAVARQLRCVVCQNLSVADSPSEMARQMRTLIRERLAQGDTPQQVLDYFEARYGEWVLLAPKLRGFSLLAWALPLAGVLAGLGVVATVLRRWTRRRPEPVSMPVGPEERERIRIELERLRE